jgi:hypothetical protein
MCVLGKIVNRSPRIAIEPHRGYTEACYTACRWGTLRRRFRYGCRGQHGGWENVSVSEGQPVQQVLLGVPEQATVVRVVRA